MPVAVCHKQSTHIPMASALLTATSQQGGRCALPKDTTTESDCKSNSYHDDYLDPIFKFIFNSNYFFFADCETMHEGQRRISGFYCGKVN